MNFISKLLGGLYFHKKPFWVIFDPELHKVKGLQVREILNSVEPGDILIRRVDGYLGSKLTPGYWSHAGLYIGGNEICHSIASGVVYEDILDFCRTDHICLAKVKASNLQKFEATERAREMEHEHLEYDFTFSDNNGKVYCTEFINLCYSGLFNSDYSMVVSVKHAFLPDDLYKSKKLDVVLEYRNK